MNRRLARLLLLAALVLGAVVVAFPLFWMVSASLMPAGEANTYPPRLLPSQPTLQHYRALFERLDLGRCLLNSAAIAVGATLLSLFFNSLAGYAFAKLRFAGRDRIFQGLVATMVIPGQVSMLPLFLLLRSMGLVNTWAGVLVPSLASVFGIFLIRQFARGIPDELLDAARVDGASEW
ncbi:MAG: carbohydrate ABC transporter permease, partial [Candidatus Polarisedimenticolia bacterium]